MKQHIGMSIHITGVVQGVGFRPFVYGLATSLNLNGWVRNTSAGVSSTFRRINGVRIARPLIRSCAERIIWGEIFSREYMPNLLYSVETGIA